MKKLFFLAATVCTILSSCSKSEAPIIEQPSKLPINLSIGQNTRANDAEFASGDEVGIYVVNYNGTTAGTLASTGNHVDNMKFTYSNSAWNPASAIYWLDKTTKADFYAYYPYSASANTASHSFSVKTDQSAEANYWASDFLWGKAAGIAPTENAVPITTNHVFSNILVYLEAGTGFTDEDLADAVVIINNVKASATINLATGVATATGEAATVTAWNVGEYYRAMIVPQTVTDGTKLITVTVDGVYYNFTLESDMTFVANKQHKFTVTINKSSNGVNIGIGGWETDNNEYGGDAE